MKLQKISKENVGLILKQINLQNIVDLDFIYDVYEMAFDALIQVYSSKIFQSTPNINHNELIFYSIGEYFYGVINRNEKERAEFNRNESIKTSMARVVTDKFISMSHLMYKERKIANKYIPTISSLNLYLNFISNILDSYEKNDPKSTLITDLLIKSIGLMRCIINLLMDGNESEAFSTWRTLHECECTLILLEKYGDVAVDAYLRHMKYGLAYKNLVKTKEETDAIFVEIKANMKDHDLKSKDMKKYIEYGWLYEIEDYKNVENFKLNFRDGLQKFAGLELYSKRYEISSELIHSTPMLFYAVKEQYYFLSLISTYESFFRLEKIFVNLFSKRVSEAQLATYYNFRNIYYLQLINIHKRECDSYNAIQEKFLKK